MHPGIATLAQGIITTAGNHITRRAIFANVIFESRMIIVIEIITERRLHRGYKPQPNSFNKFKDKRNCKQMWRQISVFASILVLKASGEIDSVIFRNARRV